MSLSSLPIVTPLTVDFIHGAVDVEVTPAGLLPQRLPAWARAQCPDGQLLMAASQPSGVRLVFSTEATALELITLPTKRAYAGLPRRPDGVYDLLIDGVLMRQASATHGTWLNIDMAAGSFGVEAGEPQALRFDGLPARDKLVEIWLPHDEKTELISLRSDAPVIAVAVSGKRRWLHHGSSISQGSNADHPTGTWPAVAAMQAGVALRNLGFGGNALLDPFTARTMRDLPADVISVKMGINLVNTDLMRLRAFGPAVHGFLDTIREGHPATPLMLISPVCCPIHETTPGPTLWDTAVLKEGRLSFRAAGRAAEVAQGKLTLSLIREQLRAIVGQRADPHLHYLDGTALYGADDNARLPLPDALHPDAEAQRLIGERFYRQAFVDGPFAQKRA